MKGNAYGNVFPNEGCGMCMIKRWIVHGDWFKIEDNEVFEKVVFNIDFQVSHLLKNSFIQLIRSSRIAMSYTFTVISDMKLEVEWSPPKLIAVAAMILFQELAMFFVQHMWLSHCSSDTVSENKFADWWESSPLRSAFHQSRWIKLVCSFARSLQLHEIHSVKHRWNLCSLFRFLKEAPIICIVLKQRAHLCQIFWMRLPKINKECHDKVFFGVREECFRRRMSQKWLRKKLVLATRGCMIKMKNKFHKIC